MRNIIQRTQHLFGSAYRRAKWPAYHLCEERKEHPVVFAADMRTDLPHSLKMIKQCLEDCRTS